MSAPTPLRYLGPGWFSVVMGLCGLSLVWHRAAAVLGDGAMRASAVVGVVAALAFAAIALGSVWRWHSHRDAVIEDLAHPVRHAFFAAAPVSLLLLATVAVAHLGPGPLARVLWWAGAVSQLAVTAWVLGRWLGAAHAQPGALWPGITPVLLIAVVGNVVAPLAGVALGQPVWSAAQLGIGVFFWPVVIALLLLRRIAHGPLPDRLLPAWAIVLAPPAVIGLALLPFDVPLLIVLMIWGVAGFVFLWLLPLAPRLRGQHFGLPWWALSFPLAAFTTLTGRLAERLPDAIGLVGLSWALLALVTLVIGGLCLATLRGLWRGELLVPEPAPAAPA